MMAGMNLPTASRRTWRERLRHRARHVLNHPGLSSAAGVFVLMLLAFTDLHAPARGLLLAFNAASLFFLLLIVRMMARSTLRSMRARAEQAQEGRWVVLGTGLVVTLATLVALGLELGSKSADAPLKVLLSCSTIVLTWVFVNTLFALHYAHQYHDPRRTSPPGLAFPGADEPDYWDFMYFAFVIGMTFQVSDIQITGRALRRFALMHGVLAFFFNVVIIALTVNIVAGLA
jgi:uncharacterized membrane protein